MLDRQVRVTSASQIFEEYSIGDIRPFSFFSEVRNIILLGDPGSGKTKLMEYAKKVSGGEFIKASHFILRPYEDKDVDYYVDALDEKRSIANNQDVADEIIKKLWSIQPGKFRLSSRLQDWMGDADLNVFIDYFENNGGYVVLEIEPLSDEEILILLREIKIEKCESFIFHARDNGLGELLNNPQNLLMLAQSVRDGEWPSTRKEIYHAATEHLLSEHNKTKTALGETGHLTAEELRDSAGELFALRLLADLPGYRLINDGENVATDGLYFHEVRFQEQNKIRGALQRRIFQGADAPGCLDYTHRTIAEFLAGQWLASKLDKGFPVGRLEALIGRDGMPVTELRGLFAWLPVFNASFAERFIAADPMGIIVNGDIYSLTTEQKRALLKSLMEYSNQTPWFITWGEAADQFKALGIPELKSDILILLRCSNTSDDMKTALLRMLTNTLVQHEDVRIVCRELIANAENHYGRAEEALEALLCDWSANGTWILTHVLNSSVTSSMLRLRSIVIAKMPENEVSPELLATLVLDFLSFPQQIPLGTLWSLQDKLDVTLLLNTVKYLNNKLPESHEYRRNALEVSVPARHWGHRILQSHITDDSADVNMILDFVSWFHYSGQFSTEEHDEFRKVIEKYKHKIVELFLDKLQRSLHLDDINYKLYSDFVIKTLGVFTYNDMLDCFKIALKNLNPGEVRYDLIYRHALNMSLSSNIIDGYDYFFYFYDLANAHIHLDDIRKQESFCKLELWQIKNNESQKDFRIKKDSYIERLNLKCLQQVESSACSISWGMLNLAAQVYWGRQKYVYNIDNHLERLLMLYSSENIQAIKAAWELKITALDFPSLNDFEPFLFDEAFNPRVYTYLAAAEEHYTTSESLGALTTNALQLLIALELTNSVWATSNNGQKKSGYFFKWSDWLEQHRRPLIVETYSYLLTEITENHYDSSLKQTIIRKLAAREWSSSWNEILRCVSKDPSSCLTLLKSVFKEAHRQKRVPELKNLYEEYCNFGDANVRDLWKAVAYLIDDTADASLFLDAINKRPKSVFYIRSLTGLGDYGEVQHFEITTQKAEQLLKVMLRHFKDREPITEHIVITRSTQKYEGEKLILRLIHVLAQCTTSIATNALKGLLDNKGIYTDELRQALHNQLKRRREAEFVQPNWRAVRETLQNKEPSNAADLHALISNHIDYLSTSFTGSNMDLWKFFWNEDAHGNTTEPKSENSGTNVLIALLQGYVKHLSIRLEPEQHMAREKRADIAVIHGNNLKIPVEVKRDHHPKVWSAVKEQLLKLYTSEPQSDGYGLYIVFWYGCSGNGRPVPLNPLRNKRPSSASEMAIWLSEDIPKEFKSKIKCFVLDVSGNLN